MMGCMRFFCCCDFHAHYLKLKHSLVAQCDCYSKNTLCSDILLVDVLLGSCEQRWQNLPLFNPRYWPLALHMKDTVEKTLIGESVVIYTQNCGFILYGTLFYHSGDELMMSNVFSF